MSWNYGPGGHQDSPYETYPAFDPLSGSQGRKDYTQASTVASTSAIPYTPPPFPQNSAPPVQFVPHYRPLTTTIQSCVQHDRPASVNPTLTPSFTPTPPLPPQSWNYDAVHSTSSTPLAPTYLPSSPPPPPTDINVLMKKSLPPPTALSRSIEGGKKRRKMEPRGKPNKTDVATEEENASETNLSAEEKAQRNRQKLFFNSIVVAGLIGQLTSIRRLESLDSPLVNPERFLSKDEKKEMNRYLRSLYKAAERKEKRQRFRERIAMEGHAETEGRLEEGELGNVESELSSLGHDPTSANGTPSKTSGPLGNIFLSLEVFVRPYLEEFNHIKLERKRMAKLERKVAKGEQEDGRMREQNEQSWTSAEAEEKEDLGSRVDLITNSILRPLLPSTNPFIDGATRPNECTQLVQVDSQLRESKSQDIPVAPPLSTPPFESTVSLPAINLDQLSSTIETDKTNEGFDFSSVPDCTLPSSVAPMIVNSTSTTSLSMPLPTVSAVSPLPNLESFPQTPISPAHHLWSQHPPFVPPEEESEHLDSSLDVDAIAIEQETSEESTSKKGESGMGQDETFKLEVEKETTNSADLRSIKEDEDSIRVKAESRQSSQQSNALGELTSTPIDSGATLNSVEYQPQSADTYRHSDVPMPTRGEHSRFAREGVSTRSNEKVPPPSSDLSEVDEGAITGSGSDDSGADSITEVLAKRKARRESSASTIRLSKKQAVVTLTLFDHFNNLLEEEDMYTLWWSDPSVSTLTRAFVQERREIFRRQRAFVNPVKQHEAIRIATSAKGIKKSTLRGYLGCSASYFTFCTIAEIPAFPVTTPSIALFLYQYRVNWPELSRGVHPSALRSFARRTAHLFEDYPNEYTELDSWPGAQDVVRELQKPIAALQTVSATSIERKTTSASNTKSPAVQSKPTPPPSKPAKLQPKPAQSRFDIVIPQRSDSKRARRTSNSPMFIESSISFASPKSAISKELRSVPVPEIGDRFKSLRAVKMSTAVANVFSQGYEVFTTSNSTSASLRCLGPGSSDKGCTNRMHATLDAIAEEWVIDESNHEHTHGPSQSLDDEEWRPFTMDRDTIEAMWQVDRRGQLDEPLRKLMVRKHSQDPPQDNARPSKKVRTSSPSSSAESSSEQSFLARSPIPPRSSAEPSRSDTSSSSSLLQKSHLSNESSSPAPFTHPITKAESINISLPPSLRSDDPNNLDLSTPPAPRVVS